MPDCRSRSLVSLLGRGGGGGGANAALVDVVVANFVFGIDVERASALHIFHRVPPKASYPLLTCE